MVTPRLGDRQRIAATVITLAVGLSAAGCGPLGRNVQDDASNSRSTGSWIPLGRAQSSDGALVVHVAASHPEHAEVIANKIVRQNYATSAAPIRVIVDPMVGDAERRVYRWNGQGLQVDTSTADLPPRASRPDADGAEAAPH